jgi:hypothetical protein
MPGRIRVAEVDRHDPRALRVRQRQPRERLLHTLRVRHVVVERPPMGGVHGFGARPEHGGARAALPHRGQPDGLAAPPSRVLRRARRHAEKVAANRRVPHAVRDDAVAIGLESRDDRVVAGKRYRRERRDEPLRPDASRGERPQVRRVRPIEVIPSPAVERDEHDDGRRPGWLVGRPRRRTGDEAEYGHERRNPPTVPDTLHRQAPSDGRIRRRQTIPARPAGTTQSRGAAPGPLP